MPGSKCGPPTYKFVQCGLPGSLSFEKNFFYKDIIRRDLTTKTQ